MRECLHGGRMDGIEAFIHGEAYKEFRRLKKCPLFRAHCADLYNNRDHDYSDGKQIYSFVGILAWFGLFGTCLKYRELMIDTSVVWYRAIF